MSPQLHLQIFSKSLIYSPNFQNCFQFFQQHPCLGPFTICCVLSCFSPVWLFVTLWIVASQAPLSMGFSRQEYWSGFACPPPGDLLSPRIEPASLKSPALSDGFFTTCATVEGTLSLCMGVCMYVMCQFSSVQSLSCVQFFLWPHEPQHTRPPCPSPTPGVHPNPCPLSRWCHPTTSSSVVPFSSCPQSFPASGSFPMSQLFASGGQNIGVSASASVLPMNTQDWSPLRWLLGSPCSSRDSQESSPTPHFKSINSSVLSFLYSPTLTFINDHWKNHSLD